MQLLKKIVNFYIFSNIHVAFASFSLTKLTLLYWHINSNIIPVFVFFSTTLSYNYIRLTRIKQIDFWFSEWLKKNRIYLIILSFISFLICIYIGFNLQINAILILIPFLFLTGLYVIPQSISKKISLRNLPIFKIFAISLSWAGISVLFPLMQHDIFSYKVLWLFLQRFLFVVALTLPFDIRDVPYDKKKIKTLPIWLGVFTAKILGIFFLILFLTIDLIVFNKSVLWIDIFITICLSFLLLKATTNQNKYYSAFWVEGIPILWLGFYLFF